MAKSGAERQAEYRIKKMTEKNGAGQTQVQMNVYVSSPNRARLTLLGRQLGLTQANMLNRIIEESEYVRRLEAEKDDFLSGAMSRCSLVCAEF